jgi:hypothetical protein
MIDQRIEDALRSSEPVHNLRSLARQLLADGQPREAILAFGRVLFLVLDQV